MTELYDLANKHGTDKARIKGHSYIPYYHELFDHRKNEIRKVFEIGIDRGNSLRMWRDYFPHAKIYAMDIDHSLLIQEDRIHSFHCDQRDPIGQSELAGLLGGGFDLMIDDGCHWTQCQVLSAEIFLPSLSFDGIYIIEDVLQPQEIISDLQDEDFVFEVKDFDLDWGIHDDRIIKIERKHA